MATLEDKHVTSLSRPFCPLLEPTLTDLAFVTAAAFQGLASQAYVALGIAGVGITVFESLRRLKRPTRNVRNKKRDAQLNSEDWSFNGYLYQARAFSPYRPVKLHSIWPFFWVWQILRTRTSDIALRSGVDSAAYVCVLQGIWIFCVFLLLTVFPALFTIHLKHSPQWYAADDLNRASLSALVSDSDNVRLLWVHVLFLWFMTIGFWIIIIYVGRQILNLRRLVLQDVIKNGGQIVQRHPEHRGWRHRTLLVSNIPVGMRSKKELQTYFRSLLAGELVLKRDLKTLTGQAWRGRKKHNDRHQQDEESTTPVEKPQVEAQDEEAQGYPPPPPVASTAPTVPQDDVVSNIVLVKRTLLVHEVFRKREDALHELEKAHIQLAKNLLARVKTHLELQTQRSRDSEKANPDDAQMDQLARQLQPFLDPSKEKDKSIWEVLADMPRDLLDPFQATRREEILFNGQKVPLIDYWLTYFNFLDERLQLFRAKACDDEIDAPAFATASKTETGGKEEEDRELKEFNPKPTPTAFVTLESAAAARLLIQKYPNHPERPWACTLEEAPDSRDLVSLPSFFFRLPYSTPAINRSGTSWQQVPLEGMCCDPS